MVIFQIGIYIMELYISLIWEDIFENQSPNKSSSQIVNNATFVSFLATVQGIPSDFITQ